MNKMCEIDDLLIILPAKQNEFQGVVKQNSTAGKKQRKTCRVKLKQRVYMVSK